MPDVPDTQRRPLLGQEAVSLTTIHGWPSIWLGLLIAAVGVVIVLVSLDIGIHAPDRSFNAPREMVALIGGIFALAGLSFLIHGIRGLRRAERRERLERQRASEPWMADYPWNSRWAPARGEGKRGQQLWGLVVIFLFLVPFNWLVFWREGGAGWVFLVVTVIFDLVLLLSAGYLVYLWGRRLKYGKSRLDFARFPFLLGERFEGTLTTGRAARGIREVEVTLRAIEEVYDTDQKGSRSVVCYQVWAQTQTLENSGSIASERLRMDVTFDLPEVSELSTHLSQRPARYWELAVKAETPGIDYAARYLVPVYSRDVERPTPS